MLTAALRRNIGQVLWWIGMSLALAGTVAFFLNLRLVGGIGLGAGLLLLGSNILLNGELVVAAAPRPFSARGSAVRGRLTVRAGLCDLRVALSDPDRIARMVYGPFGKPSFEVVEGLADIKLLQAFPPAVARWQADLAGNVLWDADIRSSLGDLLLDLNQMRFETLEARSAWGRLSVALPRRGYARMTLHNRLGDVEIFIPPETGVKIAIRHGPLAAIHLKNERLVEIRPGRYMTPDFETAHTQIEVLVETGMGDVTLAAM